MKILFLGLMMSLVTPVYAHTLEEADTYACFQENAERSLLSVREEAEVVARRPDGTAVHKVTFFVGASEVEGYGVANAETIDAAAVDSIQGEIRLRAKRSEHVLKGRVSMLGDVKDVTCYVLHDKPVDPEDL